MLVNYIESIKDKVKDIPIEKGNMIYCTDTRNTMLDIDDTSRLEFKDEIIYLNFEKDKKELGDKYKNKIYFVRETNIIYKWDEIWFEIKSFKDFIALAFSKEELAPVSMYRFSDNDEKEYIAPRTLSNSVYMRSGERLSQVLNDINKLTIVKSKAVYLNAEYDGQYIFNIPFPTLEYDLEKDGMFVIIRGFEQSGKYMVNENGKLILDSSIKPLNIGEFILFIFHYTVMVDPNTGVIITTENIQNNSITTEKLDPNIRISANNIVQTIEKQFVSQTLIDKWNNETHTVDDIKSIVNDIVSTIIDNSPDTLDTLKEIANALGNDPNFATTMTNELSNRYKKNETYSKTEVNDLLVKKFGGYISSVEPTSAAINDLWLDTTEFVFRLKTSNGWIVLGGAYKN